MLNNLFLVRVDDRLIHGQVMTAWMKTYNQTEQIIIVDDQVANDEFMLTVLKNAAPKGIRTRAITEEKAIQVLQKGLKHPSIILVKSICTLRSIIDAGIDIDAINIGGMGMKEGRTPLYKNVSASEEERACIRDFKARGIDVAIQITPAQQRIELNKV